MKFDHPPEVVDMESALLSAILLEPAAFDVASDIITAADFFTMRNHLIFAAMGELARAELNIDILTLQHQLRQMQKLDDVGDQYLKLLVLDAGSPHLAETYAQMIAAAAAKRALYNLAVRMPDMVRAEKSVEDILTDVENALYQISDHYVGSNLIEVRMIDDYKNDPPLEWLLDDFIPCESLNLLYGPSGSSKSGLAFQWSVEAARIVPVMIILAEGERGGPQRIRAYEKQFGAVPPNIVIKAGPVDLFSEPHLAALRRLIKRYNVKFLVVDTFAMCTGEADENSTRDMKTFVDGSRRLVNLTGCSVLVVHHTNKEGVQERGNQSLRNACDTVIRVEKVDDDLIQVESQKSRDGAIFETFYMRREVVDLGEKTKKGKPVTSVVLVPSDGPSEMGNRVSSRQLAILREINREPTLSLADLTVAIGMRPHQRGQVGKMIDVLVNRGFITPYDKGAKSRFLTSEGEAVIAAADSSDSCDSRDSADSARLEDRGVSVSQGVRESVQQTGLFPADDSKHETYYSSGG